MASPGSGGRISAAMFLPQLKTIHNLRSAAAGCQGCDLYRRATQTVFGEGPEKARLLLIGEQPGNQEDREGRPFVGPAGLLLRDCLREAGIDPAEVYLTNAVKHFKWAPRGKLRLHKKPGAEEISACRPWLCAEIDAVSPKIIVCLGATAAQALLGGKFRVTQRRGEIITSPRLPPVTATIHPSAILRMPDREMRHKEKLRLIEDLRVANRSAGEYPRAS